MACICLLSVLACLLGQVQTLGGVEGGDDASHAIEVRERILTPEDGLLLGNGDLSVSVYQTADRIVWRFGKGDVWDRRLDLSEDPKPAHIDEVAHGIAVEGWKCPPYGGGSVEATRGTENPQRMKELCVGAPPSYIRRPYPCPKPVGELALQLPPDQMGMQIVQRLSIEEARLTVVCSWQSGVKVRVECFIPPAANVLVVHWVVEGWTAQTLTGNNVPPLWFSLYRWPDPSIQAFGAQFYADYRHDTFRVCADPKATPLPTPVVKQDAGVSYIEQAFPPDGLFPDGFHYAIAPFTTDAAVTPIDMAPTGEARMHILPAPEAREGRLAMAVTTSSDPGGHLEQLRRTAEHVKDRLAEVAAAWESETREAAAQFWSASRVRIADPVFENLWYETLHAQRCVCRPDTVPPGLFLPSTVQDYSHWHGDYHTNYNLQGPYLADYTANHFELGDTYFKAIEFFLPIGRKIARDYYGCRGVFIQLSGYPILAEDDPMGCVPMGRMAYMTGWASNQYWWRYLYSMDEDWLRSTGYPVIRDCALFFTDFLKKGEDGLYHAFPSNQGEDGFTGDPKDYTDRAQIMQHIRYCLRAAVAASEVLNSDVDLRDEWMDRLAHCAGDDGQPLPALTGIEKQCYEANPPEFGFGRPFQRQTNSPEAAPWPAPEDALSTWYFGPYGWFALRKLRAGEFSADRDAPVFRDLVQRWRHPNGLVWGMAIANYGQAGAWTESLGVIAPLQEMMLQSWDGSLRVFPAWPRDLDCRFENLRCQGAFVVSAAWTNGHITDLKIISEKGVPCRLQHPWSEGTVKIVAEDGSSITPAIDAGVIAFDTRPGATYRVLPGA